ncbi:MAG TPA: superoxide dismutase family protein [Blastocatellia bacterium]|nr:superoxide dismutase family protein [Blastocatellia bacterium]
MKIYTRVAVGCVLGAAVSMGALASSGSRVDVIKAKATIAGAPGSGISGEVLFIQTNTGFVSSVLIVARVSGLAPNSTHGFHIHEIGVCTPPGFTAAGGHFDPGPFGMSNPDANHPFHMGDIPNLKANSLGVAFFEHVTSRITLDDGPVGVFDANGTAVIVHQNPDQGTTGVAGGSGGPRIACGVVEAVD